MTDYLMIMIFSLVVGQNILSSSSIIVVLNADSKMYRAALLSGSIMLLIVCLRYHRVKLLAIESNYRHTERGL